MPLTHDAKTSTPLQIQPISFWRRFRFPLVILVVFGCIFAIPWICLALNIEIEGASNYFMATQFAPALGVLLIGMWWLFFSSFRWSTRLAGVLLATIAVTGFCFSLRDVEMTAGRVALVPRFHFVWEPTANEQLVAFLHAGPRRAPSWSPLTRRSGPRISRAYRVPTLTV